MVKPAKLYALLLQSTNRSVSFRDFVALVEAFGFVLQRTRGSHRTYAHPNCPRFLVIQPRGKDAVRYQIFQFLDLVEQYALNMEA